MNCFLFVLRQLLPKPISDDRYGYGSKACRQRQVTTQPHFDTCVHPEPEVRCPVAPVMPLPLPVAWIRLGCQCLGLEGNRTKTERLFEGLCCRAVVVAVLARAPCFHRPRLGPHSALTSTRTVGTVSKQGPSRPSPPSGPPPEHERRPWHRFTKFTFTGTGSRNATAPAMWSCNAALWTVTPHELEASSGYCSVANPLDGVADLSAVHHGVRGSGAFSNFAFVQHPL